MKTCPRYFYKNMIFKRSIFNEVVSLIVQNEEKLRVTKTSFTIQS